MGLAFDQKCLVRPVHCGLGAGGVALVRTVIAIGLSRSVRVGTAYSASEIPGPLRIEHLPCLPVTLLLCGDSHADQQGGNKQAHRYSAEPVHAADFSARTAKSEAGFDIRLIAS